MKNKKVLIAIIVAAILVILGVVLFFVLRKPNTDITITFNIDENTILEKITIKKGEKIRFPKKNPEKEGFNFVSWTLKDETVVGSDYKPETDTDVYAKWIKEGIEIFTVKFDSKGGSKVNDLIVEKGKKLQLPKNPTKEGYEFITWKDKNEVPIGSGALLSEDITLYAYWEKVENNKNVEVTDVKLDKTSVDLIIGKTDQLKATVLPNNATNKTVTFTSNKPEIIDVDNTGKLTAKKLGEATITVKTNNGKTKTAKVYSDVESISVKVDNQFIAKYGSAKTKANVTVNTVPEVDASEITLIAPDASGANAPVWTSSNGYTLNAKDVWSSGYATVSVKAEVGRKTSNEIKIYVEPELKINKASGDAGGSGQYASGSLVSLSTNTNVTWSYPTTGDINVKNVEQTLTTFKAALVNNRTYASGLQITATSKAGQTAKISLNVKVR